MLPFSYEDRHPVAIGAGFGATNEEPEILKTLVKPFKNGLGIASGGEVALFNLLPKAQDSLVLVDHSYRSLRALCLKALFLTTLGPIATKRLLITEKGVGWAEAIEKVQEHLPASLRGIPDSIISEVTNVRREWFYVSLPTLKKTIANLHKIKIVHGDLTDTSDRGPYDFLYLSNALEHSGRSGKSPVIEDLSKLLTSEAHILWTKPGAGLYGINKEAAERWKTLKQIAGYRTSWGHCLSLNVKPQAKDIQTKTFLHA